MHAPIPVDEAMRLDALRAYRILDTEPDASFDDITKLASFVCGTPIALVSFVDENRQWFKARVGLDVVETDRCMSICAWAILDDDLFEVPDTVADARFADTALVVGEPRIRFYAGMPLRSAEGMMLGTLCVIDVVPRTLTDSQRDALRALARQVSVLLDGTVVRRHLAEALATIDVFDRDFASCVLCGDMVFNDKQMSFREFLGAHTPARFHDTVCTPCTPTYAPEPSSSVEDFVRANR
jgi:GAF domain-containing protein